MFLIGKMNKIGYICFYKENQDKRCRPQCDGIILTPENINNQMIVLLITGQPPVFVSYYTTEQ